MERIASNLLTDLQIRDLKVVLAVAEAGSFRQASLRLNLSQSATSRRVQKLEDNFGVSLFERRSTGARLTTAGERFTRRIKMILDDLNAAVETVQSAGTVENGLLRVGLIASLSRGPIRRIFEQYLNAFDHVEICFHEADRSELLTMLSHRRIDVVVAAGEPEQEYGDGLVVSEEDVFLAVAANHPWADKAKMGWDDVKGASFVLSANEPGPEIHDYVVRRISGLGRSVRVRRHRLGREGVMTLVGLGLGVSIVADHWLGVEYPNVKFVPIGDEEEKVPFTVTWRPENDNPALRRFISLARIEAKQNGAPS